MRCGRAGEGRGWSNKASSARRKRASGAFSKAGLSERLGLPPPFPLLQKPVDFLLLEVAKQTGADILPGMVNSVDSPKVAKRRLREKRTISQMVAMYCAGHHDDAQRTETAHCGEAVCPECKVIDDYALLRTERCRQMATKVSCEQCGNHCYRPEERQRICAVMRYAGPRMITKHPIAAIRHLLGK